MGSTSSVYRGHVVDGSDKEAVFGSRVFPVVHGEVVGQHTGRTALFDVQVQGLFDREEGQPDVWSVRVPGAEGEADEFELPMHPWNLSDLDPYEGQERYREIAEAVEGRLGRTGLTIVVG